MSQVGTILRDKALLFYRQRLVEKLEENQLLKPLRSRDALRLKLERLFGSEHDAEIEENDEVVLGAVIEEFSFLGIRTTEGGMDVVWSEPCPHCGHQMPSKILTSIADLGQEVVALGMTGKLDNHECPSVLDDLVGP